MISELLTFLNENSGAIGVVFSALVTTATLVYAILTWKLVNETRRMRKAQTDAKVTVRVEPRKEMINFIDFIICNEGMGPAYNVQFNLKPHSLQIKDESIIDKINSLGFIQNGIKYLSPNQEIRTFLTSLLENFEKKIDTKFYIYISYRNASGEQSEDNYLIDMSIFKGINQLGKPPLYSIAKSLEEIQKDFHNISTGFSKLWIITQSKSNFLHEQEVSLKNAKKFFDEQKKNTKT